MVLRLNDQAACRRIIVNLTPNTRESICIYDANFGEPFLPNRRLHTQLFACPEGKSPFNELHRLLHAHLASDSEQHMQVIGHNHEIVQPKSALRTIVIEDTEKQLGGFVGLQQVLFTPDRRCHKKCTSSGHDLRWVDAAGRNGHKQRLKPKSFSVIYGMPEGIP